MSQVFDQVIDRAVTDAPFRDKLIQNPAEALEEYNISLSPDEIQALNQMAVEDRYKAFEDLSSRQQKMNQPIVLCGNW